MISFPFLEVFLQAAREIWNLNLIVHMVPEQYKVDVPSAVNAGIRKCDFANAPPARRFVWRHRAGRPLMIFIYL